MEKKVIYAVGISENGVRSNIRFYDTKEEAEKTLHYYLYAANLNAFIDECELESKSDKEIPDELFVEANFNYRTSRCKYDHIGISTYQRIYSFSEEDFKSEKVHETKSDRCGVRSTSVCVKFIIDTRNESREELEDRCKEKTKEIYERYLSK